VRRALLVLVCALPLAACGGGSSSGEQSKSADQIAADAQNAARSAKAVHVSGKIVLRGVPLTLDLRVVRNVGAVGRMGLKGGTLKLVRLGPTVYMNGDGAFWTAYGGPRVAGIYSNRWLKVPTSSQQIGPFVQLTDIDQLFGGTIGSHGKIEKGGTTTYHGSNVIVLRETGSAGGKLYIAASGKPYPVAVVSAGGGSEGSIAFDDWNKSASISVPKGAG
jgi:hypothetical protein